MGNHFDQHKTLLYIEFEHHTSHLNEKLSFQQQDDFFQNLV